MNNLDASATATVDLIATDTIDLAEETRGDEFFQGAAWALNKLALWLEKTNIVADDEKAQPAVDATKGLVAGQARLAADNLPER